MYLGRLVIMVLILRASREPPPHIIAVDLELFSGQTSANSDFRP